MTISTSSAPTIDAALQRAASRLRIFPCHSIWPLLDGCDCKKRHDCKNTGKHPHIMKWPDKATTDEKQINKWWAKWDNANIGVVTGIEYIVIEVDPRHGGYKTLARLEAEYGALPRSWTVASGSAEPGLHIYLSLPPGIIVRGCDRWKPEGVEIKGWHQYVIGAGSLHKSGNRYVQLSWEGKTAPLIPPDWLSQLQIWEPEEPASGSSKPAAKNGDKRGEKTFIPHNPTYPQSSIEGMGVLPPAFFDLPQPVLEKLVRAVDATFPRETGNRNHSLCRLAQRVVHIREVQDRDPDWFEPLIQMFLEKAEPLIGKRDLQDSMAEWVYIWGSWVRRTLSMTPLKRASDYMQTMTDEPVPEEGYKSQVARAVVNHCAAMQATCTAEDGVWYLSTRDAAGEIGRDREKYRACVGKILNRMIKDGMLVRVYEANKKDRLAAGYKYIGYHPNIDTVLEAPVLEPALAA